jgi:hypothetical protein
MRNVLRVAPLAVRVSGQPTPSNLIARTVHLCRHFRERLVDLVLAEEIS